MHKKRRKHTCLSIVLHHWLQPHCQQPASLLKIQESKRRAPDTLFMKDVSSVRVILEEASLSGLSCQFYLLELICIIDHSFFFLFCRPSSLSSSSPDLLCLTLLSDSLELLSFSRLLIFCWWSLRFDYHDFWSLSSCADCLVCWLTGFLGEHQQHAHAPFHDDLKVESWIICWWIRIPLFQSCHRTNASNVQV